MIGEIWPLVRAAMMQALDRHTIDKLGVPSEVLMESAGRAVVEQVLAQRAPGGVVVCVCGAGHNGGDGLVVARHLAMLGIPVRAAIVGDPEALRGDPAAQLARARAAGVPIDLFEAASLDVADVVVDALFGTGLGRAIEGDAATAVEAMREARGWARVVSVDLPSGIEADTGRILGTAVLADATVTFGLPKIGLALEPGRTHAGSVRVARIGIADEAPEAEPHIWMLTRAEAGAWLPQRPRDAHKGSFGHVLVVAGSTGKTGAAILSVEGAARIGAGLVTLACPASLNAIFEARLTEAMTAPVAATREGALASDAEAAIVSLAHERDVLALGPGIGTEEDTRALVRALVDRVERPVVIDADGLNCLAGSTDRLAARRAPTVLTPHPGEAGRWLGCSPAELNQDRVASAERLAGETQAVVVLKGAGTVVADPGGDVFVNPTGGPLLATGGTGDVLTGLVAGLLAQGLDPFEAAVLASFVHGECADRLSALTGDRGRLAGDLVAEVPATCHALRERADSRLTAPEVADALTLRFPEP